MKCKLGLRAGSPAWRASTAERMDAARFRSLSIIPGVSPPSSAELRVNYLTNVAPTTQRPPSLSASEISVWLVRIIRCSADNFFLRFPFLSLFRAAFVTVSAFGVSTTSQLDFHAINYRECAFVGSDMRRYASLMRNDANAYAPFLIRDFRVCCNWALTSSVARVIDDFSCCVIYLAEDAEERWNDDLLTRGRRGGGIDCRLFEMKLRNIDGVSRK